MEDHSRLDASIEESIHSSLDSTNTSVQSRSTENLMERNWRSNIRSHWKIVVAGQVISLLVVSAGAAQSTLSLRCSLSAPAFSTGLYYFGLSCFLIPLYRRQHVRISQEEDGVMRQTPSGGHLFLSVISLEAPAWAYFIMAGIDVYASYFTVLALRFTTITSVSLLTALAVPSTMVLSYIFLDRRFSGIHVVGVALCLCGVAVNVMQDYEDDQTSSPGQYPHKLRGDIFAIIGGFLYGANDVLGEVAVRKLGGPTEYLGMLGTFATIICTFQTLVFERTEMAAFFHSTECSRSSALWLLFAFACFNWLGYVAGARFLQVSEATFFNLSLQTGGLWSVLFSVLGEHIIPEPGFFLALVLTVSGVCVYEMSVTPVLEDRVDERGKRDDHIPQPDEVELECERDDGADVLVLE